MAAERLPAFLRNYGVKVDDPVTTVPGIGVVVQGKLRAQGVTTVGALIGLMMTHNLDEDAFVAQLVGFEVQERCAKKGS